ncbi:unnamed protein product [Phytophthora lilii]|uniref:Unnamed protein product n=1 Tax=Phytophthora lilii TaxID=2077276 RepID=A0A9W6XCS2_9STRA|nr:unnamed protein product [Phytophthora lilii]
MYQSADKSNSDTLIADSLARVAFAEGDSLGDTSPAARASEFRKTSPGTSAAEVHKDRASRKKTPKSAERKRSREECALDRESSSRRPRLAADATGPRSNVESRPSGFSKAKSKSRSPSSSESSAWSASTQVLSSASEDVTPAPRTPSAACRTLDLSPPSTGSSAAGTRRSSRASAAQSSFKSSLMCELEDADDEDVLGGSSPPLARPRSSSRPIVIDDDSDDDSESSVEPARTAVLDNTLDSSVDKSRPVGSEVSAVPGSNASGHSPAHEALASGARAPSDGSSAVPTSREVSVLPEVSSPSVAATRESESTASTALVVRDSSIPAPPSVKAGSVQKSAAKTQAKAKTSAVPRSSSSRSQSRRRPAKRPQVDASMSSLPGLDSSSLRPVPLPEPVHGDQPQDRFSKQVIKWARPYMTPKFKLPGASKCWSRILNCRLPIPVPSHTRVPCTAAQIEAFADYKNPRHPWQVVRRQLPPHACLISTVDFDVSAKVSQRASFDQRLRSYWRTFRGFGDVEDADLGFALWERDHWIPARAVDLFFSHAFAVLANIRSTRCGDGLLTKTQHWPTSLPKSFLSRQFLDTRLTWIPKSLAWLSEVSGLDELQPWRTGWVGAPALQLYNTTFMSRNPSAPLFVPVGFSRESVGRQIQVDPALTASEISAGWDSDFRGPASPDLAQDASSATPRLATSNDTLVAPSTEDPGHLLFLTQVSAAAEDAGEDGGDASEGS